MPEPSDREWQELVEVLGEVADTVTDAQVEKIEAEERDDSTQEDEGLKTEEETSQPFRSFTSKEEYQEHLNEVFKQRMEGVQAKQKQAEEKARREAAEKAAEENEEFKTLATSRAERITELEAEVERLGGVEEKATAYETTLNGYAQARIDELNLQKGVIDLLSEKDAQGKLDWLAENGEDFAAGERVLPADDADETGTPEADEAARGQFATGFARDF